MTLSERLAKLSSFHSGMVDSMEKEGVNVTTSKLVCEKCRNELQIGKNDVTFYLSKGWPECCGLTMTWVTK